MRYTPEHIWELEPNEIFVFGSNKRGKHGAGAAYVAAKCFGAQHGVGVGRTGSCYAIATKDENFRQMPLHLIKAQFRELLVYATTHQDLRFLVTPVGCGLAGYTAEDIAPLFFEFKWPPNVIYPKAWAVIARQTPASPPSA